MRRSSNDDDDFPVQDDDEESPLLRHHQQAKLKRPRSASEGEPLSGALLFPPPNSQQQPSSATTQWFPSLLPHRQSTYSPPSASSQHNRAFGGNNGKNTKKRQGNGHDETKDECKDTVPPQQRQQSSSTTPSPQKFLYCVIYAIVNIVIAVPGLYGYAAVIFNHPIFAQDRNALSKLVIFSSLVHQLGFVLFSSMDFAIGTVQDAGLIFLSSMARSLANSILDESGYDANAVMNGNLDVEEVDDTTVRRIVSTTLLLLCGGTALLGLVLFAVGKAQLANAFVAYLPMPVVGGYLAFIGYFCIQAGVALCISTPLISLTDWKYLFLSADNWALALPGLGAGLLLTVVSRWNGSDALLPAAMVLIPTLFYVILFACGSDMDTARDEGWVGPVAPPTPVSEVLALVDFGLVQWHLVGKIVWTWVGMVFVVSFASCLDVCAIAMDKGEALDTNRELATVGICNFMSGLSFGFTGSYIFSQTIFTYRTGVHSRWIGIIIMIFYLYFVFSPMNLMQIAPLFFLGSTLIFIGYDLFYEWLYEIRQRVLWSEYATIWGTFMAIQFVGVDFGILIGVLFAIVEHAVATAQTTTVHQVRKRSRAVWAKEESNFLHRHAYRVGSPSVVTLEIVGPVFFGSSLSLLGGLRKEVALTEDIDDESDDEQQLLQRSPHTSSFLLTKGDRRPSLFRHTPQKSPATPNRPPQFCVLDLTQVSHMDASAARSCFLQFTKLCQKRGICVCASGATPRIAWMLRSHDAAYSELQEEERVKAQIQAGNANNDNTNTLLFSTTHEALEFCEASLLHQYHVRQEQQGQTTKPAPLAPTDSSSSSASSVDSSSLSYVLAKFLGSSEEEKLVLKRFDGERYHDEIAYQTGEKVVTKESRPESFYIVLKGAVASGVGRSEAVYRHKQQIVSGAGLVTSSSLSNLHLAESFPDAREAPVMATIWPVGGVFGYSDLLLDRPRTFGAFSVQNDTRVARVTRSGMNLLQREDAELNAVLHRVLLKASVLDLANCTCDDV